MFLLSVAYIDMLPTTNPLLCYLFSFNVTTKKFLFCWMIVWIFLSNPSYQNQILPISIWWMLFLTIKSLNVKTLMLPSHQEDDNLGYTFFFVFDNEIFNKCYLKLIYHYFIFVPYPYILNYWIFNLNNYLESH